MALNILKWRPTAPKFKVPKVGAIGEPDAHVFNCPKCARPLTEGTPRCPGCGTRLIMGVAARRASILMGAGFIVGLFLGGGFMSLVISNLISPTTPVSAADSTDGSAASSVTGPGASPGTLVPDASVPAGALSSLRQASLLDSRIAADARALSKAYKARSSGADLAPILRSLASNASIGGELMPQLRTWDKAHALASARTAFYSSVSATAIKGLRASVTDRSSYRTASKRLLTTLKKLVALDAASRALALEANLVLPDVDLSHLGS